MLKNAYCSYICTYLHTYVLIITSLCICRWFSESTRRHYTKYVCLIYVLCKYVTVRAKTSQVHTSKFATSMLYIASPSSIHVQHCRQSSKVSQIPTYICGIIHSLRSSTYTYVLPQHLTGELGTTILLAVYSRLYTNPQFKVMATSPVHILNWGTRYNHIVSLCIRLMVLNYVRMYRLIKKFKIQKISRD